MSATIMAAIILSTTNQLRWRQLLLSLLLLLLIDGALVNGASRTSDTKSETPSVGAGSSSVLSVASNAGKMNWKPYFSVKNTETEKSVCSIN